MLSGLKQRLANVLKRVPLVRSLHAFVKYTNARRRPVKHMDSRAMEAMLEALVQLCGPDRLPPRVTPTFLAGLLADLTQAEPGPTDLSLRRILFFSVKHHVSQFGMPLAATLAARGCAVDYVWMPYADMREDHPVDRPYLGQAGSDAVPFPSVELHPRLRLVNLLHVPSSAISTELARIAESTANFDTCSQARRELVDYDVVSEAQTIYGLRLRRNRDCLERLTTLLRLNRYDSLLTINGGLFEFAMAYELARFEGLAVVTFEFGEQVERIWASLNARVCDADTPELWRADEPHRLTPEREARVMKRLLRREQPNWKEEGYNWQGQPAAVAESSQALQQIGLSSAKPTVLLCTNISWDSAVLGKQRGFPSMVDWVVDTVAWFNQRPDWQLIVRCHPAEAFYPSNDFIPGILESRFPTLNANIQIVKPAATVNTYSFLPSISFALVYTSTTGLEMACRGIPVVVAGVVHYAEKGFTHDPATRAEYFAILEKATASPASFKTDPRMVELARCYADVYFNQFPRPFPWTNSARVEESLKVWPLKRVLQGDCPAEFLKTIDFLAGRQAA